MENVKEIVFKHHTALMKSKGIDRESSPELEIRRRNGIDSLGMVSMILDIEEDIGVELDEYLPEIRKCHDIGELIAVIEKACEKNA